jgi:hypothetical protein
VVSQVYSDQQLQAFLDESLSTELMSAIEQDLRNQESLRRRLVQIAGIREAGIHGLGEIWRRNRLSCPSREQLGSFLLGAMDQDLAEYIRFHVETVGCRLCNANLRDLENCRVEQRQDSQNRRQRYFQTSVGHLTRRPNNRE